MRLSFIWGTAISLLVMPLACTTIIEVSPKAYSLNVCEEKKLSVSVKDAQVTWQSTNPKVATVNEEGIVVGRSPGFTFIRAVHGEVKSNPVSLFVRDKGTSQNC